MHRYLDDTELACLDKVACETVLYYLVSDHRRYEDRPAYCIQPQLFVDVSPFRIVDARHHPRHFKYLLGYLARHQIRVVAARHRDERVLLIYLELCQKLLIKAVSRGRHAVKCPAEALERIRVLIYYGDVVPFLRKQKRQL